MSQGYLELVFRSDAWAEFTVQTRKHDFQGQRRSIDYRTANQTQSQGSVERMGGCHRMASLVLFIKTSAYALDWTYHPRALRTPSFRILLLLTCYVTEVFARNSLLSCVSLVHYHAGHWCLSCPSLDFYRASHWHLACLSLMSVGLAIDEVSICAVWLLLSYLLQLSHRELW